MSESEKRALNEWLTRRTDGGQHDSKGEFTLSAEQAWKKLGRYRLPFEHAWLYLLVQAGVRARATSFQATQTRDETVVTVNGVPHWTQSRVEEAVFRVSSVKGADLVYLAGALRALFSMPRQPVEVVYADAHCTRWTGSKVEAGEPQPGNSRLRVTYSHYQEGRPKGPLSPDHAHARWTRSGLSKRLGEACLWSPVWSSLDRRRLGGVETGQPFLSHLTSTMVCYCPLSDKAIPAFPFDPGSRYQAHVSGSVAKDKTPHGCAMILLARHRMKTEVEPDPFPAYPTEFEDSRSQIVWWKDGVSVAQEEFGKAGPFSLTLLLNASDLETDLSGLQLRESAERERRIRAALKLCQAALESIEVAHPPPPEPGATSHKSTVAVGALLSPLLLAGPGKLLWFGAVTLTASVQCGINQLLSKKRERQLCSRLALSLIELHQDVSNRLK